MLSLRRQGAPAVHPVFVVAPRFRARTGAAAAELATSATRVHARKAARASKSPTESLAASESPTAGIEPAV